MRGNDATDLETLAALAREPEIRDLARGRARVRLLWEACQIPDFRKLADDSHVQLCARVFGHVVRDGSIPADWIAGQIDGLARADGDIDTLMQRLAGVRVWTYIAARGDWVRDAAHWQARAREVEDLLSDALHERLTARFVDRRAAHLMRRLEAGETRGPALRRHRAAARSWSRAIRSAMSRASASSRTRSTDGDERRLVLRAARRALREEMPRRVARLEAAADAAFAWLPSQRIAWDGAAIARLRPGPSALRPQVEVLDSEFLDGAAARAGAPAAAALRRRRGARDARAAARRWPPPARRTPRLRGPLHRLVRGAAAWSPARRRPICRRRCAAG